MIRADDMNRGVNSRDSLQIARSTPIFSVARWL